MSHNNVSITHTEETHDLDSRKHIQVLLPKLQAYKRSATLTDMSGSSVPHNHGVFYMTMYPVNQQGLVTQVGLPAAAAVLLLGPDLMLAP